MGYWNARTLGAWKDSRNFVFIQDKQPECETKQFFVGETTIERYCLGIDLQRATSFKKNCAFLQISHNWFCSQPALEKSKSVPVAAPF